MPRAEPASPSPLIALEKRTARLHTFDWRLFVRPVERVNPETMLSPPSSRQGLPLLVWHTFHHRSIENETAWLQGMWGDPPLYSTGPTGLLRFDEITATATVCGARLDFCSYRQTGSYEGSRTYTTRCLRFPGHSGVHKGCSKEEWSWAGWVFDGSPTQTTRVLWLSQDEWEPS